LLRKYCLNNDRVVDGQTARLCEIDVGQDVRKPQQENSAMSDQQQVLVVAAIFLNQGFDERHKAILEVVEGFPAFRGFVPPMP